MPLSVRGWQWVIDLSFGLAFLIPLAAMQFGLIGHTLAAGLSIGAGIGYILHSTWQMLWFNKRIDEMAQESVEQQFEEKATDSVKETVEAEVEEQFKEVENSLQQNEP